MQDYEHDLCPYCGCPLTPELDVNNSITYDPDTDSWCCAPACADGLRRFVAGERAQTVEDARRAIAKAARFLPFSDAGQAGFFTNGCD